MMSKSEIIDIPTHIDIRPPMPAMNPSMVANLGSKSRTVWTKSEYRIEMYALELDLISISAICFSVAVSWKYQNCSNFYGMYQKFIWKVSKIYTQCIKNFVWNVSKFWSKDLYRQFYQVEKYMKEWKRKQNEILEEMYQEQF